MAITKAQLARRCAEKLRILAPNETFSSEDLVTISAEIDTLKDELSARIFGGVTLWTDDNAIPTKLVPGFLWALLPAVAPHYENTTVHPNSGEEGYKELCRQLATKYDPDYDPNA